MPRRAEGAMDVVTSQLVRRDAQIVLLLTPPFDQMEHDPGYIKGYLPGIRENGGQYTHAALWTVIALARLGRGDEAMELFHMINPTSHARSPEGCGPLQNGALTWWPPTCTRIPCTSAGADGLGTRGRRVGCIRRRFTNCSDCGATATRSGVSPCVPAMWPEYSIDLRHGGTRYRITVDNSAHRHRGVRPGDARWRQRRPARHSVRRRRKDARNYD
jgi:cyclic beta-1,2-glucan synthetase